MKARIMDIKRFSVHDGSGIRTTVFFKGCPLRCLWCHNPEGLEYTPSFAYYASKCINCGACSELCKANSFNHKHRFDRNLCNACGQCESICPSNCFKLYGREFSVDEIFDILYQDIDFYKSSDGGITLSGGECLMQSDFCAALLKKCKAYGIHTAVDTCGYVSRKAIDAVIPYSDIFLYDIKAIDNKTHIRCTGKSNDIILSNLIYLQQLHKPVEIRFPYVPGYNGDQLTKIAEFLSKLNNIVQIKILPFHNLSNSKYQALQINNTVPNTYTPTADELFAASEIFKRYGIPAQY